MSLQFGVDPPPEKGPELWEVGWNPECGHIRHLGIKPKLEMPLNPNLTYGLLTRDEVDERFTTCGICRPPEQDGLGL